ncbi:unnamed protein product [Cuscuta campestris]|uniref:DYW domain-containing protein n=1 Tax=Cuscuta campestris TaxID=132261 RepID=A0A484KG19_9ASTE|nr:unnamed protein product [Cuscuta campestris]
MKAILRSKPHDKSRRKLCSFANSVLESTIRAEETKGPVWVRTKESKLATLHCLVQQCARERDTRGGRSCHAMSVKLGFEADILTSNMFINFYSRCGLTESSRKVFDEMPQRSLVSWNTLIGSYTRSQNEEGALKLYVEMQREGIQFSEFTVSGVLCACAAKFAVFECKQLHAFVVKVSMELNVYVGTALIDVYAKSGMTEDASRIFNSMTERNEVTWTTMMTGYVQNALYEEALLLFHRAQQSGLEHDKFIVSSVLSACSTLSAFIEGTQVHAIVWKLGFGANAFVASSLIDLYAKCGNLQDAYIVFSNADEKNIVIWNTMITGLAKHARPLEAMILFEKMQQFGIRPSDATYASVLSACGHMGLVEEGKKYFKMMSKEHNLSPNIHHYSCMVDVLGRAGLIEEAKDLIETMPFEANASVLGSLLASCKVHGNVEVAEAAAKQLFEIEPNNAGNYVLLSDIYAAKKRWGDVASTRKLLKDSEVKKVRGKSWIEIKGKVHAFMAGERGHPRIEEIYSKLEKLAEEVEKAGYEGETEHDFHDVGETRKKQLLKHHSEKLALTFGLMSLPSGLAIRIMKNLRICGDCHSFMKFASKVTGRVIVVRDYNRFHHFKDGSCSCGEFW